MTIVRPPALNGSSMLAALSTRDGGPAGSAFGMNLSYNVGDDPANVRANREHFLKELGVAEDELAIPRQIHSSTVLRVDRPGVYPDADGLITDRPRVFLTVTVADCIPLLLVERERNVIAAVHSGWRGTAAAIALEAIKKMTEEYGADPRAMTAYIGPSASACCYAVSQDVASKFNLQYVRDVAGEIRLDLKGAVVGQLLSAGIPPAAIEINPQCTISEPSLFHSHRRDGAKSGRMMGLIGLIR